MSKHTPGPWFIQQELAMQRDGLEAEEINEELLHDDEFGIYAGNPIECKRSLLRGHKAHICDIAADHLDFDDDEEANKETALANARLIAAAPDLLEMVKELLDAMGGCDSEIENAARDLVAKLEGGAA